MGRALCLVLLLGACYSTAPQEGLTCSDMGKCPSGLQCDPDTFTCVKELSPTFPLAYVVAGRRHSCGTNNEGEMFCWGDNSHGQLGVGDAASRALPTHVESTATWEFISAGDDATCAISSASELWCWGNDQIIGTFSNTPRKLDGTWLSVSVGNEGFCAVDTNHAVWCGWNSNPLAQVSGAPQADFVTASNQHACAINTTSSPGDMYCFGGNDEQQAGTSTANNTNGMVGPTPVAGKWKGAATAADHTCGIQTDGTLYCWGRCDNDETGQTGKRYDKCLPTLVDNGVYYAVAAGGSQTCALEQGNNIVCFGENDRGQLGRATIQPIALAGKIESAVNFEGVSVGEGHGCGWNSSHTAGYCWGDNSYGQLGNGEIAHSQMPARVSGNGWFDISVGVSTTCAVAADHSLWCWGSNGAYQIANGSTDAVNVPWRIGAETDWAQVSVGSSQVCGRRGTPTSTVWCWGDNQNGQLGLGSTADVLEKEPKQVGQASDWSEVQAGSYLSCGIRTGAGAEGVYCWGDDTELSPHNTENASTGYRRLAGSANVNYEQGMFVENNTGLYVFDAETHIDIAMSYPPPGMSLNDPALVGARGLDHDCMINTRDELWCWGDNSYGQLGRDQNLGLLPAAREASNLLWKSVDAGAYATCGITDMDKLYCWGRSLTVGSTSIDEVVDRPTQINPGTTWKKVSVGEHSACAIQMDDSMWCWGDNTSGELGDGATGKAGLVHIHPAGGP